MSAVLPAADVVALTPALNVPTFDTVSTPRARKKYCVEAVSPVTDSGKLAAAMLFVAAIMFGLF